MIKIVEVSERKVYSLVLEGPDGARLNVDVSHDVYSVVKSLLVQLLAKPGSAPPPGNEKVWPPVIRPPAFQAKTLADLLQLPDDDKADWSERLRSVGLDIDPDPGETFADADDDSPEVESI
jgi:hypothetical protein